MKKKLHIYLLPLLAALLFLHCSRSSLLIEEELNLSSPAGFFDGRVEADLDTAAVSTDLFLQWEFEAHASFENSSVVCAGDIIFFSVLSGRVYALDLYTGDEIGMLKYDGHIVTAPLVNDSLIVSAVIPRDKWQTKFVFHNFTTNTEQTEILLDGKVTNELLPVDGGIAAVTERGTVYLVEWDGSVRWKKKLEKFVYADPVVFEGQLLIGTDDGLLYRLSLSDGSILQSDTLEAPIRGITVMDTMPVIATMNSLIFLDDESKWKSIPLKGLNEMGVLWGGSAGYIGTTGGEILSFNRNGTILWRSETDGLFNAKPLLLNGLLLLPDTFGKLLIYDAAKGQLLAEYEYEGKMRLSPFYYTGYLFIGFDRGNIYAYHFHN